LPAPAALSGSGAQCAPFAETILFAYSSAEFERYKKTDSFIKVFDIQIPLKFLVFADTLSRLLS
jgi:hypothetical protein